MVMFWCYESERIITLIMYSTAYKFHRDTTVNPEQVAHVIHRKSIYVPVLKSLVCVRIYCHTSRGWLPDVSLIGGNVRTCISAGYYKLMTLLSNMNCLIFQICGAGSGL